MADIRRKYTDTDQNILKNDQTILKKYAYDIARIRKSMSVSIY